MTTISITTTPALDIDKVNKILNDHNTSKNAILNRFLLYIQLGKIDLADFLNSDVLVKKDYDILNERIDTLWRRLSNNDKILSDTVNVVDDISSKLTILKDSVLASGRFQSLNRTYIIEAEKKVNDINQNLDAKIDDLDFRLNTLETTFKQFLDILNSAIPIKTDEEILAKKMAKSIEFT